MAAMNLVVDEYLHLIVRTQPWDKRRFEAELERMEGWLAADLGGEVQVDQLTGEQLERYFASLPDSERAEARRAATSFFRWSRANGWIRVLPIAG